LKRLTAEVKLASAIPGHKISKMFEINVLGKQIGQPITSLKLNPIEVRFLEMSFVLKIIKFSTIIKYRSWCLAGPLFFIYNLAYCQYQLLTF